LFKFVLQWDVVGNFLKMWPWKQVTPTPSKAFTKKNLIPSTVEVTELESFKALGNPYAVCKIGCNYMFHKTGLFLSRSKICWLYGEDAALHKDSIDENTALGNLLHFFENSEGIDYCILGNVVDGNKRVLCNDMDKF
jgi:hypothetical protein